MNGMNGNCGRHRPTARRSVRWRASYQFPVAITASRALSASWHFSGLPTIRSGGSLPNGERYPKLAHESKSLTSERR